MNFISTGLGNRLLQMLGQATGVNMAVAFFCPDDSLLDALASVPNLTLIISEEFTINDPSKLERLPKAKVRSIRTDHEHGKLHAKVAIVNLNDGSTWVLMGSANLTHAGMFSNQEACVEMISTNGEDKAAIAEIRSWFDIVLRSARIPDLELAKRIFKNRSLYRLEKRPATGASQPARYLALKTTSGGPSTQDHWPQMLAESALAVGWEDLSVDPSRVSEERLRIALRKDFNYKQRQIDYSAKTLLEFVSLEEGAVILVCQGFSPNQKKGVHIYGFARITGPFRVRPKNGAEWRFMHDAVIQEINATVPRDSLAAVIQKESLMQTMHALTKDSFVQLADTLGVTVEV